MEIKVELDSINDLPMAYIKAHNIYMDADLDNRYHDPLITLKGVNFFYYPRSMVAIFETDYPTTNKE